MAVFTTLHVSCSTRERGPRSARLARVMAALVCGEVGRTLHTTQTRILLEQHEVCVGRKEDIVHIHQFTMSSSDELQERLSRPAIRRQKV